ncbi:recombinase family protein [Pseudarthrobacter sp. AL07]|uniref:recombinase family protein n=1 Tax=unclassified Pseudarthrobacter TaxID=2647000 RepID=UPI00249B143A|nr:MULTISPECIES: recombinase family protein [unclassified Pseudarthrobacter]MDI3193251.1 recombinase family protein [Pseudarthrobacter sp. AL20]MDI3207319.1 recombinase family protein [Pseudarthrobacter sp. AL07]
MTAHRIGYARVSTRDQNLGLQIDALKKAGCDKIYEDTISGTKSHRPGLDQSLDTMRDGDTLVVWKPDRLRRSVKDLLDFAGGLNNRGVDFVSLTDAIDTTTASGRFFFNVMASLAQMERELMVERTQAGLLAAREQGWVGGRKRIMTEAKIRSARKLLNQGTPPREVATSLGVSVPTLYRWVPAAGTPGPSTQ